MRERTYFTDFTDGAPDLIMDLKSLNEDVPFILLLKERIAMALIILFDTSVRVLR